MKTIKVKFVDFWPGYEPKEHFIYQILSKKYEIDFSENPDYVFFSVHGTEHLKYNNCIKIFYTGENLCPDFNLCDYAIGFEYMSYGDRYFRLPNFYNPKYKDNLNYLTIKRHFNEELLQNKEGFCSFVYSNGNANPIREEIYEKLNQYKKVYSGGRFKNNVGGPVADKIDFQKKYKFCIAFENSSHSGYTTEKIIQAYASNAIPIYWGDPDIEKTFNPNSFININAFNNLDEAIEYIKDIDTNDDKYLKMINEPIFISSDDTAEKKYAQLEGFLINIVEQSKELAKRFNRVYWGEMYINKQVESNSAYNRSILQKIKKIWKRIMK